MKGLAAALLGLLCTSVFAAITVVDAYPSDDLGQRVQPRLGESFYMTARLRVDQPVQEYRISFTTPYESLTTTPVRYAGDARVTWGTFTSFCPKMAVTVSVDEAVESFVTQVLSSPPTSAIEYFAPKHVESTLAARAILTKGSAFTLKWWIPKPSSSPSQQLVSSYFNGAAGTSMSAPFGQPVAALSGRDYVRMDAATVASSVRVNEKALSETPWSSYSRLPASALPWLRTERFVEVRSSDVNSFVSRTLPLNYRNYLRPYEAAKLIYKSTVKQIQYSPGVGDQPSAALTLRTRRGDCGYLSSVFVASCRNIGIPARTVCGAVEGDGQWHVWAEFYVPGAGWVACDPSYAANLAPLADEPAFFGTIPDLNSRVIFTFGFDHAVGSTSLPLLQSPAVISTGSAFVEKVVPFVSVRTR